MLRCRRRARNCARGCKVIAELAVYNAIKTLAATYPDVAPANAVAPWIVYQQVGGEAINWLENTDPGAERARVQVSVWATTRAQAAQLSLDCESAIRASNNMQAEPIGARVSVYEPDTQLYGCQQDFRVMTQS